MPKTNVPKLIHIQPVPRVYAGEELSTPTNRNPDPGIYGGIIGGWTGASNGLYSTGISLHSDPTTAYISIGNGASDTSLAPTSATDGAGLYLDQTGLYGFYGSKTTLSLTTADGAIKAGSDLSAAATTSLVVAGAALTYNSESLGAGDVLLGDNSSAKANIHWNHATGQLEFRGGTTVKGYIDTTGAATFGGGDVLLDNNGITIANISGTGRFQVVASSNKWFDLTSVAVGGAGQVNATVLTAYNPTTTRASLVLSAIAGGGEIDISATADSSQGYASIRNSSGTFAGLIINGPTSQTVPADVLDVRGNIAQVNSTNGQQLGIKTLTELTTIAASPTTDTAIQIPVNAVVLAVSVRVTTVIPTAATFTVTGTTSGTVFDTAAISVAANTTDVGTAACPYKNGAAQTIRITPNLTPANNTGRVRVTIHYYQVTAPTS